MRNMNSLSKRIMFLSQVLILNLPNVYNSSSYVYYTPSLSFIILCILCTLYIYIYIYPSPSLSIILVPILIICHMFYQVIKKSIPHTYTPMISPTLHTCTTSSTCVNNQI
ncbi:hypothetical protein BC941DRAFT_417833 [Chlamydoabsidia padenii]|nr:hypothetical protein BC941DRAFT_417833 [Chlamydoabsidia padenii]